MLGKRATVSVGALAGAIPVAFAAAVARDDGASAACDEAVVRTMGRGYTGVLHGLDAIVTFPFGARAQWASIACAGFLGIATFTLARRLVRDHLPGWLGLVLALVAAAMATLTLPVQHEALLTFGAALGATLVLLPVVLVIVGAPLGVVFVGLGLAITYDAPVAAASTLPLGALALMGAWRARSRAAAWMLVGTLPVVWMSWRHKAAPEASLDASPLAGLLGEGARATTNAASLAVFRSELGVVAVGFALVGLVFALRSPTSRPPAVAVLAIVLAGIVASACGAPAGPTRYGAALLAAIATLSALSACGMAAIVVIIGKAKVPLARASAAMIVVLDLAVPVRIADDTSLAIARAQPDATPLWNRRAFGGLPENAVLVLPSARLLLRARAASAVGALRTDVVVVPTFGLGARATSHDLAREPLLGPMLRDFALYGAPEEFSLSQLSAARPVLVAFDPRWDKLFARHLVPQGAFDRYLVEPRGQAERLKSFSPLDDSSVRALTTVAPLSDATRDLARARAIGAVATGEHDWADVAIAELRRIAPHDALATELSRRAGLARGPVEVRDLAGRL